jgi:hypothetical protein
MTVRRKRAAPRIFACIQFRGSLPFLLVAQPGEEIDAGKMRERIIQELIGVGIGDLIRIGIIDFELVDHSSLGSEVVRR